MTTTRKQIELAIADGSADTDALSAVTPRDAFEIKRALPFQMRFTAGGSIAPTAKQIEAKVLSMVANVQVADRMGDLLIADEAFARQHGGEGWVTDYYFLAGGPYLHLHNHDFTVGKAISARIEDVPLLARDGGKTAPAIILDVQFFDDSRLPFSQADYLLALEGMRASSVGFRFLKVVFVEDDDERNELGLGRWGVLGASMELLECSKVPVPANQAAAGTLSTEADVSKALDRFVREGKLEASLAADYRRMVPLTAGAAARRSAERVRSWVEIRSTEGADGLECVTCSCQTGKGAEQAASTPPDASEGAMFEKMLAFEAAVSDTCLRLDDALGRLERLAGRVLADPERQPGASGGPVSGSEPLGNGRPEAGVKGARDPRAVDEASVLLTNLDAICAGLSSM